MYFHDELTSFIENALIEMETVSLPVVLILVVATAVGDFATTAVGLFVVGASEANPAMASILKQAGFTGFVVVKLFVIGIVPVLMYGRLDEHEDAATKLGFLVLAFAWGFATVWNLFVFTVHALTASA